MKFVFKDIDAGFFCKPSGAFKTYEDPQVSLESAIIRSNDKVHDYSNLGVVIRPYTEKHTQEAFLPRQHEVGEASG